MSLRRLQAALEDLYQVDTDLDIEDFLLDEASLVRLGEDAAVRSARGEVLFVTEEEGEVGLGLFLDESLRASLGEGASARFLATFEGVSHFVFLVWRAQRERPVRQLELELQAEVDKFAAGVLGLAPPGERPEPRDWRRRLYEEYELHPDLDAEEESRYRAAAWWARRYAVSLERRYLSEHRTRPFVEELRDFYRLGFHEKLAHIDAAY